MAPAQGWHEQILGATLKLFLINVYGCSVFRDVFFCEHASLFCLCCFCSWRQRYFAHVRHWVIPGQKNDRGTYLALEFVQGLTVTS